MDIIIGRDAATQQLKLTVGTKELKTGSAGSVPLTVSRRHCALTVGDDKSLRLSNLNPQNQTFVNGVPIESKSIKPTDAVALGADLYRLDVAAVLAAAGPYLPKTADIRPLGAVWEERERRTTEQTIAERRFNALRSATGLVTMTAIVLAMTVGHNWLYMMLYGLAILATLGFTIKAYRDSSNAPKKLKQLEKAFRDRYVCPNCGHHFNMPYDELTAYDNCPFCKAKFIK